MPIEVCAHITGTIWKIEVSEGDPVEKDQLLLTLESMKMEMDVVAPRAGRIQKVVVRQGQGVEEDDLLLTLE
jgi:acetyl-CoA carboxylase biotin carboxyl carrier protein